MDNAMNRSWSDLVQARRDGDLNIVAVSASIAAAQSTLSRSSPGFGMNNSNARGQGRQNP